MSAPDRTTGGMKGGGYYDVHSEYQRRVVEGGETALRELVTELDLEALAAGGGLAVVDYGAGTGATSVRAVRAAIDAIDDRAAPTPIAAIHNDVPTSDFSGVFRAATSADGYMGRSAERVYPMAAAGSFFEQVVPRGSASLGMCSNAAHWLREQPDLVTPGTMYHAGTSGEAREALGIAAAADWRVFRDARAAELAPGGGLLVQGIATTADGTSAALLLEQMWEVAAALAADGLLDPGALERYVFPVYCRSVEEATAADDAFEVLRTTVEEVANPYWEQLDTSGDRDAYARDYSAFVRAFSESTMREHLFETAAVGIEPAALADEFFRRFEAATTADPDAGRYECWILRLALRRRKT